MKKNRQKKILELVDQYAIGTQDELIARLRECDYTATQATVSRDIRSLKLIKVLMQDGSYRYVQPKEDAQDKTAQEPNYRKTYADSIREINYALNNVVIKTTPGMASALALVLDQANHDRMLGCVAGDDTIIVVTRSTEDSRELAESIRNQSR